MNVLGIFAKRPEPGKTKTRLAKSIGNKAAADLYAAFVEDLLKRFSDRPEKRIVAVTPENADTQQWFASRISADCELHFQPQGNLGDRIQWFFDSAFSAGASQVVLIGSDSPDLPASLIDEAFERLKSADMVLAPAADGGYVLVGMSQPTSQFFSRLPWSTPTTLTATIAVAKEHGLELELLPPWYDIDTVDNLGTLLAMQQTPGSPAAKCPATQTCLESLWPDICRTLEQRVPTK